jgi:D-beta-D-heptose 7-phosphate kinase/D-beta-D-heptose 1-phosphate adenosyltransferase
MMNVSLLTDHDHRATGTAELALAVRRLARSSVLVVGDAMLDRYVYGTVDRVSREAPVPVLCVQRELAVPGGAGNVVRNLGALGAAVAFVSVVGDDQAGSDLTGLIGGQPGVEPWLLVQGGRATTLKTRFMAQGQQILRTDREDVAPIHPKLAERLQRIVRDAMAATTVTILSDYGKGVLAGDLPGRIIAAARAMGRRVVVDTRDIDYARYAGADLIMPNMRELARSAGLVAASLASDAEVAEVAAQVRAAHGFGAVLVTRAEDGMTLVDGSGVQHFRGQTSEIFDVSGAGDTAVATLGAGLAAGLSLPVAARLANIASGIVLGRSGMALARESDLLAAIAPQGAALRKILSLEAAAARVEHWRREGWQTAVTLGGFAVFDDAARAQLQAARQQADRLIVGLHREAGPEAPHEAVRAATLACLDCVDLVVITGGEQGHDILHALHPDLLIGPSSQTEADLLATWGGTVARIAVSPVA